MSLAPEWLDAIQWPAMLASIAAAWLVASNAQQRRNVGFWVFLGSNALWIVWGVHTGGWALVTLQIALAVMNVRGLKKTTTAVRNRVPSTMPDESHIGWRRARPTIPASSGSDIRVQRPVSNAHHSLDPRAKTTIQVRNRIRMQRFPDSSLTNLLESTP